MALPIAVTPKLGARASRKFLERVEANLKKPYTPIPTPKLAKAIAAIRADARKAKE